MPSYCVEKITKDLYILRIDDNDTKFFEGIWEIPEGITYNAYLLALPDKKILFDGWKRDYSDLFLEAIQQIVDPRDIDYIVVHHMEPDHTGTLPVLIKENSKARIISHPMSRQMISSFYGLSDLNFIPTKDNMTIKLDDEELMFIHTPWLHWPETMVTYLRMRKTLLTCDVFGGYSVPAGITDVDLNKEEVLNYLSYARKYMVTVIGSYREHVKPAINKIKKSNLEVKIIAPGHGLVWLKNPSKIINAYLDFAENKSTDKKVTIIYTSMYGFVENIVRKIRDYLVGKGLTVAVHQFTDKESSLISDLLYDVDTSGFIILGISNYEAGIHPKISSVLDVLKKKIKGEKQVLIVTVYGWGDAAKTLVKKELEGSSLKPIGFVSLRAGNNIQLKQLDDLIRKYIV